MRMSPDQADPMICYSGNFKSCISFKTEQYIIIY
jgi:hypothetical protein